MNGRSVPAAARCTASAAALWTLPSLPPPSARHCPAHYLSPTLRPLPPRFSRLLLPPSPLPGRSAPELLMGLRCTAKADVYSFGVVLWEIAVGEVPIRGQLRDPM